MGLAVLLVGDEPTVVATSQLWAIATEEQLHVGWLCNRNLATYAAVMLILLKATESGKTADTASTKSNRRKSFRCEKIQEKF